MTYIVKNSETGEIKDVLDIPNVRKYKKENPGVTLETFKEEAMLFEAFEDYGCDDEDDF